MADELLDGITEGDLKLSLAPNVRNAVDKLDQRDIGWDQIGLLLTETPNYAIALKGGSGQSHDLWSAIKEEFVEFLCSNTEQHHELRSKWVELREQSVPVAVAWLSAAIGSQIGIVGGMIAPVVVWLLITAHRIGTRAFCRMMCMQDSEPTDDTS